VAVAVGSPHLLQRSPAGSHTTSWGPGCMPLTKDLWPLRSSDTIGARPWRSDRPGLIMSAEDGATAHGLALHIRQLQRGLTPPVMPPSIRSSAPSFSWTRRRRGIARH
jgi:hypothetical protein